MIFGIGGFGRSKRRQIEVIGKIQKSIVNKSIEMKDVKIDFLSLVTAPANKCEWLIAKNSNSPTKVKYQARLLKSEDVNGKHFITGVVYEPMVADAHDNFMTSEEIKKACDWFNENGLGADSQHNEMLVDGVTITKSWVLEEDSEINGKIVKAGTWVAEAEVTNDEIWKSIQNGEITGWSMGGQGTYILEQVDIEKQKESVFMDIMKTLSKTLGIQKGEFAEKFNQSAKRSNFWTAFNTLEDVLYPVVDTWNWTREFAKDPEAIREALTEFSEVINSLLLESDDEIVKSMKKPADFGEVKKAGKEISSKNMKKLKSMFDTLNEMISEDVIDLGSEEDEIVKAEDIKAVAAEVAKMLKGELTPEVKPAEEVKKSEEGNADAIAATVTQMVLKELGLEAEPEETMEQKIVKAVQAQLEPILKQRGISKQITTEGEVVKEAPTGGYMDIITNAGGK